MKNNQIIIAYGPTQVEATAANRHNNWTLRDLNLCEGYRKCKEQSIINYM